MAINVHVPIALPTSAADYITSFGTATTLYLEYGTATTPADGTATTPLVSGTEQYEFWVSTGLSSYFRWRVGDGSDFTPYSATWQEPQSYATLQEVVRGMDFPDESRYDELEALLIDATAFITDKVCGGRSFFRNPVGSGTTTITLDIQWPGQSVLSLARGRPLDILSLTTVEIAPYTGADYVTVASGSTGYFLTPDKPNSGWPYTDLVLSDQGSDFTTFPTGWRTVRLTTATGWDAVPRMANRATIDLVRFWYNDRNADGSPVGMSAFGTPVFGANLPKSVRELFRSDYAWHQWIS